MTIRGIRDVENLSNRLSEGLGLRNGELLREINSSTKAIANKGARILRKTSPNRTGEYASNWSAKKIKGSWVIYNKERYQLTHLLEKGHPSRLTGGNVAPRVHIAPVEQQLVQEYINEIERILRG